MKIVKDVNLTLTVLESKRREGKSMSVVTIPKKLIQAGELVVLPRKEYEALVRGNKHHKQLDHDLDTASKKISLNSESRSANSKSR